MGECFIKQLEALKEGIKLLWTTSSFFFVIIFIFSFFIGAFSTLNALCWKIALDNLGIMFRNFQWSEDIMIFLAGIAIISSVNYICQTVLQYSKQTLSDKLDLTITQLVLKKSLTFSMETFDNVEIYDQINLATSQTSQQCLSLLDALSLIISSIIQAIGMVLILFHYNTSIIFISIISAVPTALLSLKANSYWYSVFVSRIEKLRLINYLKTLMIKNENVKEIKLYNVGEKIVRFIKKNYISFLKDDIKMRKNFAKKKVLAEILDEMVTYGIKIWIIALSIKNHNTLGTVVLFLNSQQSFKFSIMTLLNRITGLQNSVLYLQAICTVKNFSDKQHNDYLKSFDGKFSKIKFENVSFKYPNCENYALKNISLTLESGKSYSIVGFNGSGKTTLIKLILKLYQPTSGAIYIDDTNINEFTPTSYYKHISAVFQDFIKYPFTIGENIAIRDCDTETSRLSEIEAAAENADIADFIGSFVEKYDTKLMKDWSGGIDLSQGQWQKIAIARCFYGEKSIAIFDEAFSSIDAQSESNIIRHIAKFQKNTLNIFVTHRFSSICLADKILVMENGEIKEHGTHSELIYKNGVYAKLYSTQISALKNL